MKRPATHAYQLTAMLLLHTVHAHAGMPEFTDPTRPYDTGRYAGRQAYAGDSYVLNSVLVSEQRRVAVINGKHVSEGETVGNATVVRIGKYDVILQSPNRQITVKLLPDIVKKQP